MTITLQGYLHRSTFAVWPELDNVICQDCGNDYLIKGDERIELEYNNVVDMEEYAEIIESTMERLGWVNRVCPTCMGNIMEFRRKHSR